MFNFKLLDVAPARERGLKSSEPQFLLDAWFNVAPARERGLKLLFPLIIIWVKGRSREGAWIEIPFLN